MREFTNVAEMRAHYREVLSRRPPQARPAAGGVPPPEPELAPEPEPLPHWISPPPLVFPLARVARIVCEYYGIDRGQLVGSRRVTELVRPRQVFCYVCRMIEPQQSWPRIGRHIGRDHTTALHSYRKIARMMEVDVSMALDVAAIVSRYNEGTT